MDSVRLIAVSTVLIVVLAFALLFVFLNFVATAKPDGIPESDFARTVSLDDNKKIFILGSSYVGRINASLLQNYLYSHGYKYSVYNLARSSDLPKLRLQEIDTIIAMKPDIVVYGVGFRDFEKLAQTRPENILPNIQEVLTKQMSLDKLVVYLNHHGLGNPQVSTLKLLQMIYGETERAYANDTPFYPAHSKADFYRKIKTNDQLQKEILKLATFRGISNTEDFQAMEKILDKFSRNNIKVILFSTPYSIYFLDTISSVDKRAYVSILEDLHKKFNVPTYVMLDKYARYKIWTDSTHVSLDSVGNLFTFDIGKMVIKVISSAI